MVGVTTITTLDKDIKGYLLMIKFKDMDSISFYQVPLMKEIGAVE